MVPLLAVYVAAQFFSRLPLHEGSALCAQAMSRFTQGFLFLPHDTLSSFQ